MRSLTKRGEPQILEENALSWLRDWLLDRENPTKKYRYRHQDIKAVLVAETYDKCAYCESRIGATHPGETEHKIPSSREEGLHFYWPNLTRACTECNRRKNNYYAVNDGFLDPYLDDVEAMLIHLGPTVFPREESAKAEVAVRILEFNVREKLLMAKIEVLQTIRHILSRYRAETDATLKELLRLDLLQRASRDSEYSAMVGRMLLEYGIA